MDYFIDIWQHYNPFQNSTHSLLEVCETKKRLLMCGTSEFITQIGNWTAGAPTCVKVSRKECLKSKIPKNFLPFADSTELWYAAECIAIPEIRTHPVISHRNTVSFCQPFGQLIQCIAKRTPLSISNRCVNRYPCNRNTTKVHYNCLHQRDKGCKD